MPTATPPRLPVIALAALTGIAPGQEAAAQSSIPVDAPAGLPLVDQADLRKHASHLASDELGGRYTGMPGQVAAAEYIKNHFEQLGLAPLGSKSRGKRSYYQHYTVERTFLDPKKTHIQFGQKKHATGFAVIPGKGKKPTKASGEFVYCGTGNPKTTPKSLRGKIPVVLLKTTAGGPRAGMRGNRQVLRARDVNRAMAARGARVCVFLVATAGDGVMDSMNTSALLPEKHVLWNPEKPGRRALPRHTIPSLFLPPTKSKALLTAIGWTMDDRGGVQETKKGVKSKGTVQITVKVDKKFKVSNVCAVLEGTDRRAEALVYSAHMDHMGTRMDGDAFNGADDNASGTAGMLDIAEAFAKSKPGPRRSVIFLAVSGEELGLWGSLHYSKNPTWPAKKIIANINIDMIGRQTSLSPENVVSATPSKDHAKFSTLVRTSARLAEKMGMRLSNGDTYYRRSDHYNFARIGIPVVFFCDGEHADYHQVTDHADKLDYAKMEKIARLAFWTGWEAANARSRPKDLGHQNSWTK